MIGDFDLIDILRDYCTLNDIFFIPGTDAYINAVADMNVYADSDLILIADFTSAPSFTGGRVTGNTYTGVLALGRKTETYTTSTLDETWEQKYDRRLKSLSQTLASLIGDIACENEFEISNVTFKLDINKFDLNADFVAATISFTE